MDFSRFSKRVRKQDAFQIMYEAFVDENNKLVETGNILLPILNLYTDNSLYYFDNEKSKGHYDKNGKSVKSINKTPINGARLNAIWDEKAPNRWI